MVLSFSSCTAVLIAASFLILSSSLCVITTVCGVIADGPEMNLRVLVCMCMCVMRGGSVVVRVRFRVWGEKGNEGCWNESEDEYGQRKYEVGGGGGGP